MCPEQHSHIEESKDLNGGDNPSPELVVHHYGSPNLSNPEVNPSVANDLQTSLQNDSSWAKDYIASDSSYLDVTMSDPGLDDMNLFDGSLLVHDASKGIEDVHEMQQDLSGNITGLDEDQSSSLVKQDARYPEDADVFSFHLPFDVSKMGAAGYKHIVEAGNTIFEQKDLRVYATNSPFSDHIRTMEHLLRQKIQHHSPLIHHGTRYVNGQVLSRTNICSLPQQPSKHCRFYDFHIHMSGLGTNVVFYSPHKVTYTRHQNHRISYS